MTGTRKVHAAWVVAAVLAGAWTVRTPLRAQQAPAAPSAPAKPAAEQTEKFAATTINLKPGAGEKLTIHVLHWSTDADRGKLVASFKDKSEDELQSALGLAPTLGYIWTSESLGYSLRYAHKIPGADGSERVLLATDRRLGVWTRGNIWKGLTPGAPDYPFTLIELHIAKRGGISDGKTSLGAKVAVDEAAKAIVLENYAAAPIQLKDVKREDTGTRGSN
jgi:hypothetical protein